MKKTIILSVFALMLVPLSFASSLSKDCEKQLKVKLPDCSTYRSVANISEVKNKYQLLFANCSQEDFQSSFYVLILESSDAKSCKVVDFDTSFVGYMFEVDSSLKSNQPVSVYGKVILAELNDQIRTATHYKKYIEKLKAEQSMGSLTKDKEWVLKNFKR